MHLTLSQWLSRSPAGPKPKRPLRRNNQLRRVSKKRRLENAQYSRKRQEFLSRHKFCAVSPALFGRKARATEIHHRNGRVGANFLDESTWLPVSRPAHEFIHSHPSEARRRGWLT